VWDPGAPLALAVGLALVLLVDGLTKRFGDQLAVDDVSFALPHPAGSSASSAPTGRASRRPCA
jgi:hypothetical protein